ncbi:MAG: hypothetical protein ACSHW0_17900 [Thalassotalea sp.]
MYLVKKEPYFSSLLFSIPLALYGLVSGNPILGVFIGSAILFALAFVAFWLLDKVPNGTPHYSVLGGTLAIIVFLI